MTENNNLYETIHIIILGKEPTNHSFDTFDQKGLLTTPSEVLPYMLMQWGLNKNKPKTNVINEAVSLVSSTHDDVRCELSALNEYLKHELESAYRVKEIMLETEYYYQLDKVGYPAD